jgi:two-component system response regulator DctR
MLHIVDDEAVVRDSLSWLATSRAIPARAYESGLHFLAQIGNGASIPTATACCSTCACRT